MRNSNVVVGKYRGIRLGRMRLFNIGPERYRVRLGRELSLVTLEALNREWLDAYVAYFKSRGKHNDAADLRVRWLAAQKVRA